MADIVSLRPRSDDDETELPLGFEALDDIKNGNVYVGQDGKLISREMLTQQLRGQNTTKRVVRVKLSYRLPSDDITVLHTTYVNIPVIGRLTSDELARVVHTATRTVYDALRGKASG